MRSIRISSEDTSAKEIRVTRLLLISFRNNFSSCLPVPYTYIYIILWWNTFLYSWLYAKVTEALLYQLPCAWFSYRKALDDQVGYMLHSFKMTETVLYQNTWYFVLYGWRMKLLICYTVFHSFSYWFISSPYLRFSFSLC